MRISLLMRRKYIYGSLCVFVILLSGCISIYSPRSGVVVEKESGLPIENAILVRSWDRGYATPAGATHSWLATSETATDENGRFSFWPRVFFSGIPLLMWTEENSVLVYKPGYGFATIRESQDVIELPKIPFNRYSRAAEANKAHSSYGTDFYKTELLKGTVQQEEKLIKELPELTKGVLYTMSSLNDIAIDSGGNIFLANHQGINKIPKNNNGYDTVNIGEMTIYNTSGAIELEIENDQLYALRGSHMYTLNVSSENIENTQLATKQFIPGRGLVLSRPMTGVPATVAPGYSRPPRSTTKEIENPILLTNNNPANSLPSDSYRFALDRDGLIHIGGSRYQKNGELVDKQHLDVSSLKHQTAPKVVDTVTDDEGNTLVAFYFPSETSPLRSGIARYDKNHRYLGANLLPVNRDVTSISAAAGLFYACDSESFYILDKNLEVISRQLLSPEMFGEFDLRRIKVDSAGENLFLIDSRYGRLLWYDLKSSQWR